MKIYTLLLFITLISCGSDKIYKKQLANKEIEVDWYYYSYITSNSPNYVSVKKNNKEKLIFEYGYGLQDIEINQDTIVIFHLKFYAPPKVQEENVFGYYINYREVSSHEMYLKYLDSNQGKMGKQN